jgi:succinoglycan biosynthesis protein ExoO
MPDVSIVIACWNAEAFLPTAISTALGQTGVNVEVIVCDDASTDGTARLMASYDDPRIRKLRLPVNRGPAGARNAGFAAARGSWILVLDADDVMEPGRAAQLIQVAKKHDADIVADNFWIETASAPGSRKLHIPEALDGSVERMGLADYAAANILFGSRPAFGYLKPIFRRAFLEGARLAYDESLRVGEDFALVAEGIARGARFVRSRTAGYVYVTHSGSISHRLKLRDLHQMISFDRRFLAAHLDLGGSERAAFEAHLQALERGEAFTTMVDHLKNRSIGGFLRAALQYPSALQLLSMPIKARLARFAAKVSPAGTAKGV